MKTWVDGEILKASDLNAGFTSKADVAVTYTKAQVDAAFATVSATLTTGYYTAAQVDAAIAAALSSSPNSAPVNTSAPYIVGTPVAGQQLTLNLGTWTGKPVPTYTQQWYRAPAGPFDVNALVAITGAQGTVYTPGSADVAYVLYAKVTASNGVNPSSTVYTAATPLITAAPSPAPVNTVKPTITGNLQVGYTLTGSNGTWTNNPTSFAYQWNRDGVAINGATAITYTLVGGDATHAITFTVTASNGLSGTAVSDPTAAIAAAPSIAPVPISAPVISGPTASGGTLTATPSVWSETLQVPTNTALPTITGTATEGQTLTGSSGSWTFSPTSYAYQWRRDGSNVVGATSITYVLVTADVGHQMTLAVDATNSAGTSASPAVSNPTATVSAAGGAGTALAWSTSGAFGFTWDASISFPGDHRTIVADDGHGSVGTRALATAAITGKTYYEIKINARNGNCVVGLSESSGSNPDRAYYFWTNDVQWDSSTGNINYGQSGSLLGTLAFATTGQVTCWALDVPSKKFWVRVENGQWNGSGTANPATGVGGFDLPAAAFDYTPHFRWDSGSLTDSATLNTQSTAWTYSAPSGFSPVP